MKNENKADTRPMILIELKKLRLDFDLTSVPQMASILGVPANALSRFENGTRLLPDMESFYKSMANHFKADVERLKFCVDCDYGSKALPKQDFRFIQYLDNGKNTLDLLKFFKMTRNQIKEVMFYVDRGEALECHNIRFGTDVKEGDYIVERNNEYITVPQSLFTSLFK